MTGDNPKWLTKLDGDFSSPTPFKTLLNQYMWFLLGGCFNIKMHGFFHVKFYMTNYKYICFKNKVDHFKWFPKSGNIFQAQLLLMAFFIWLCNYSLFLQVISKMMAHCSDLFFIKWKRWLCIFYYQAYAVYDAYISMHMSIDI